MEFHTTIRNFPDEVRNLNIPPDTAIRIIIEKIPYKTETKSNLPFLHSGVWDDGDGPTDISENTDDYLYNPEEIHGG